MQQQFNSITGAVAMDEDLLLKGNEFLPSQSRVTHFSEERYSSFLQQIFINKAC